MAAVVNYNIYDQLLKSVIGSMSSTSTHHKVIGAVIGMIIQEHARVATLFWVRAIDIHLTFENHIACNWNEYNNFKESSRLSDAYCPERNQAFVLIFPFDKRVLPGGDQYSS
jgi:hypothetical protein